MLQTDKDNYAATSSVISTTVAQYKEYCLQLTESQVENLIEFFEFQFIPMIRNDEGIDNINYIADMMQIFTKLRICEQEIKEFKDQMNCEKLLLMTDVLQLPFIEVQKLLAALLTTEVSYENY